jgi:hypothetical protein
VVLPTPPFSLEKTMLVGIAVAISLGAVETQRKPARRGLGGARAPRCAEQEAARSPV